MVTRAEVLTEVKGFIKDGLNVRAITTRERDGYHVSVMGRYQEGGGGTGVLGSMCILEIIYREHLGAYNTTEAINNLPGIGR